MSHSPTVLQVLPALISGGVERGTIEIARALNDQGWGNLIASSGGPLEQSATRTGATHLTLPLDRKSPLSIYRNAALVERIIHEYGVNIVHARSRAPAWSAWLAAKRTGTTFVTTFHGFYGTEGFIKRRYNSVMARGEKVIAISHLIRDHILNHYPFCAPQQIRVIHRGADLRTFSPHAVTPGILADLSSKWWLAEEPKPVIMMPGRLTRLKGHSLLIDALSHIRNRDFVAVIVGSDEGRSAYRKELEQRIKKNGLEGRVRFVGNTKYMTEAYALSDVVVIPTTVPEAFGRVSVEAQAMGKTVVAADHGGMKETVRHEETGFLFKPNDSQHLAQTLLRALQLPDERRARMSEAAIAHISQHFSIDSMQQKTLALYASLL